MTDKLLISCGCSFTNGNTVDQQFTPYSILVSNILKLRHINLSRPGASNYFIAKQIEYGLTLNPDLIVIGTTTELRFDYLSDITSINSPVTFEDFSNQSGKISSRSILWFEAQSRNTDLSTSETQKMTDVFDFLSNHTNDFLKRDQDRLIILGAISKIKDKKIPFLVIDFAKIFATDSEVNICKFYYKDLIKKFPCPTDKYHFNQYGHLYITNQILNLIKSMMHP